ncbi:MAG: hypothetical protein Q9159_005258 [Coniocarpon cinnabarinum]
MDHFQNLRILLIGNGGREHAIAWKLVQSLRVSKVYVVPGNGGTATLGHKVENIQDVSANDLKGLLNLAVSKSVHLVIPGPEAPLVDGIVDRFQKQGILCFGPSKAAARMEGSKVFAKDFMQKYGIPTAVHRSFKDFEAGKRFLEDNQDRKWVIKADGLAAGKGVVIPKSHSEAITALETTMKAREFGAAGDEVVVEEFLEGEEISILSFSDGYTIRSLPPAQDHKRIFDKDEGKNTGGMGAYAPASIATPQMLAKIDKVILQPTIDNLRNMWTPFRGCLFTGFMLTSTGPKVLEYNVRFGDPESQTLLALLETDLVEILLGCVLGTLSSVTLSLKAAFSTTVVAAAGGYPDAYDKGQEIDLSPTGPETHIFHAGTTHDADGKLRTSGGRVIAATGVGSSVRDACEKAYTGIRAIHFERMHYRKDIAYRELRRREKSQDQLQTSHYSELTYADAGVSIDAGNELVQRIKPAILNTKRPGSDGSIGGFGGVFSLRDAGYGSQAPDIVSAIDGVGTKLFIAQAQGKYDTVGIDLVAMNVNDLVVQGAEPLIFLDYYACGKLNVKDAAEFVAGVAEGCNVAGCALAGGETAEMAGLYHGKDFDAAGCAIGAIKQGVRLLPDKEAMKSGDVLLGLESSGVHSNGFSLVRKILEKANSRYQDTAPWRSNINIGEALLEPTQIYVKALLGALQDASVGPAIKGLAHITGGGLVENVPRMLPDHLAARIVTSTWKMPPVFTWLKQAGGVSSHEMVRTFNCGIGMVCVVDAEKADVVKTFLEQADSKSRVFRIGSLEVRGDKRLSCIIDGSV